ncbi:MAG TPA: polysaccharide deacetylase family protein [Candidatus Aminicenantes bacterium]|nr:polysaccharide deacetylase family protein [Candidatus Aminicenantes bacterium]HRY65748.1 polysaccharide deacetylase family protein [Candidatus Aminicenantes bacterium]HRZ72662.1 polysaccharide deacetylase family protein [Candidatus Aminicenantes bacterium]
MNPILQICCPRGYNPERIYIIRALIENYLGLGCIINEVAGEEYLISALGDSDQKELRISDRLFQSPLALWGGPSVLSSQPLERWAVSQDLPEVNSITDSIPVIFGKSSHGYWIENNEKCIWLGLDIFGSAFFMLTRYEEFLKGERDEHNRFPATSSLASRENFLDRPIVDEYVEILWSCIKRLWPEIRRRQHSFRIMLSHDVDSPFMSSEMNWTAILKSMAGDVIKRNNLRIAVRRFSSRAMKKTSSDPSNTFGLIMDLSEQYGHQSEFYFIPDHTSKYDGCYHINDPSILGLIGRIHERGHHLGLHASYNSYRNPQQITSEFKKILNVATRLGIEQKLWGGRQHYLRWENPATWQTWEDAGLNYDATLSYADRVGFRCGTCKPFPVFNIQSRRELRLIEYPLVVMDKTLFSRKYMGLLPEQALEKTFRLCRTCQQFSGIFSMLWHNTSLVFDWEKSFYIETLKALDS